MAENFEGVVPKEIAVKPDQQRQDGNPQDSNLSPDVNPETIDVLDKWFEDQVKAAENPDRTDDPDALPEGNDDDDATPPKDDDATPPKDDDATPPKDDDAAPPKDDEVPDFNKIELPANARGKSAEAFAKVKEQANSQINQLTNQLQEVQQKLAEIQAQGQQVTPLTEETQKELESLRQFKNRLDIEADPSFHAQFDGKISKLEDFVMEQLRATGKIKEDGLNKIKEIGLDNVDWDDLFDKIDHPSAKRLIQARLDEIQVTRFEKRTQLEKAKQDIDAYIKTQREAYERETQEHQQATQKELDQILPRLDWLVAEDKPLPTTATPDERTVWEDNRKFKTEVKECLNEALSDNSPNMRAILVAGMAQLLKLRKDHALVSKAYEKTSADLKAANDRLAKIKKAGVTKPKEGSAPPSDSGGPKLNPANPNISAGEAMDELARQAGIR